jgi:Family of unknown function (DUF5397)
MPSIAPIRADRFTQSSSLGFQSLIGEFKTFGEAGPIYEVLSTVAPMAGADCLMRIRVLDSGELVDIPASQINKDPKAI